MISPYLIVLTSEEEPVLIARAYRVRGAYCDRLRARIVLAAAAGMANAAIAVQAGVHVDTARKWRRRFAAARLAGLKDAPRSGCPPVFTAADRAETVALACALPAACSTCMPGAGTANRWAATTTSSARMRRPPSRPAAAVTPHTTGIAPFSRLVEQVMTSEPYASANRVSWIAGNGSSHRGAASIKRMARAWPNAHLIHLPTHASWLDQAEIYFSILQRKALTPNDFISLDQIRQRLAALRTSRVPGLLVSRAGIGLRITHERSASAGHQRSRRPRRGSPSIS